MARARNIKPGLFKNEVLGVADPLYTLLFQGLWLLADRAGRLEDRPMRIKAEVFPYRDNLMVADMLDWLVQAGFIVRYRVAGAAYIQIVNFEKHQNPHKNEGPSEIPSVPDPVEITSEEIGTKPEDLGSTRADSLILIPDSGFPSSAGAAPPSGRSKRKEDAPTAVTWDAYSTAYERRYGTLPVRNAKVNGQLAQFVARLGGVEAPNVAAFYVGSGDALYARSMHSVDLMLRDAEQLRTRWATGRGPPPTSAESFRERDARIAAERVAEMTGGLVSAKPSTQLFEVIDGTATKRLG